MASRGKNFTHAVTNQPVCAPARSVLFTSRYATETGVWHNGLALDQTLPTLAGELRKAGYTANLIGKWHLAPNTGRRRRPRRSEAGVPRRIPRPVGGRECDRVHLASLRGHHLGPRRQRDHLQRRVPRRLHYRSRGTLPAPEAGEAILPLHLAARAAPAERLCISPSPPRARLERFVNSNVPDDLRALPGTWQAQLPDYYGCIEAIDNSVGRVRQDSRRGTSCRQHHLYLSSAIMAATS